MAFSSMQLVLDSIISEMVLFIKTFFLYHSMSQHLFIVTLELIFTDSSGCYKAKSVWNQSTSSNASF